MPRKSTNPVTSPNKKLRVYPITDAIKKTDTWQIEEKNKWIPITPHSPIIDRRRRAGEKYLFERIKFQIIGSNQTVEVSRLKGSTGPFYAPMRLCKQNNKRKNKFTIYSTFKFKPSVFDNHFKELQKKQNNKNKKKKKVTSNDKKKSNDNSDDDSSEESSDDSPESSIISSSSQPDYSPSPTASKPPNRLQRKTTLNKRKQLQFADEPIAYDEIKGEIKLIEPTLKLHEDNDTDAAKAMKYLTNFRGEYKSYGLESSKWEFCQDQFNRLVNSTVKRSRNKNRNKNEQNSEYYSDDSDLMNQCNHSDCEEFECNFKTKKKLLNKKLTPNRSNGKTVKTINWCNTCEAELDIREYVKQYKDSGEKIKKDTFIRDHYKTHYHKKSTHKCRICGLKLANEILLDNHYHSQHAINLLATEYLSERVKCSKCGSKRKASWDGRAGYHKILCEKCTSKLKANGAVEEALLEANVLTKKQFAAKYPYPSEKTDTTDTTDTLSNKNHNIADDNEDENMQNMQNMQNIADESMSILNEDENMQNSQSMAVDNTSDQEEEFTESQLSSSKYIKCGFCQGFFPKDSLLEHMKQNHY